MFKNDTLRLSSFGGVALRDSPSVPYQNTLLRPTTQAPTRILEIRRVFVALFVSSFVGLQSSSALKILPIADQQTSQIEIAQKEFTRIAIKDDRIKQIFGGTQDLTVEVDEEGGQIFIKPLESRSRPIRMTVITETGLTHDLKLIPRSQESESILFMAGHSSPDIPNPLIQPERNEDILTMIKKLASNSKDKEPLRSSFIEKRYYDGLSLILKRHYSQGRYIAYYYKLTNATEAPITLSKEKLCFLGDVSIAIEKDHLEPGESTSFYVVTEKEDEDKTPLR